jgi:hypothetical protein
LAEIKVRRLSHWLPITITGTDEQGRLTADCPHCGAPGFFDAGGWFVCPVWSDVQQVLGRALADLEARCSGG